MNREIDYFKLALHIVLMFLVSIIFYLVDIVSLNFSLNLISSDDSALVACGSLGLAVVLGIFFGWVLVIRKLIKKSVSVVTNNQTKDKEGISE